MVIDIERAETTGETVERIDLWPIDEVSGQQLAAGARPIKETAIDVNEGVPLKSVIAPPPTRETVQPCAAENLGKPATAEVVEVRKEGDSDPQAHDASTATSEEEATPSPAADGGGEIPPEDPNERPTGGDDDGNEPGDEENDERLRLIMERVSARLKAFNEAEEDRERGEELTELTEPDIELQAMLEEEFPEPYMNTVEPKPREQLSDEAKAILEASEDSAVFEDVDELGYEVIGLPGGTLHYQVKNETFIESGETPGSTEERQVHVAYISKFNVEDDVQGHGIGRRLMQELVEKCAREGIPYIEGLAMSEAAVKTRIRVMGDGAIEFFYPGLAHNRNDGWVGRQDAIPLTPEQAEASIDRAREIKRYSPQPGGVDGGVNMRGDVQKYLELHPEVARRLQEGQ
jgi:GNAT superfamily N-acetyltransferase